MAFGTACFADEPVLPPLAGLEPGAEQLSQRQTVLVRRFRFEGNTVFTDEELSRKVGGYVGRELSMEDLEEVRRALTMHYIEDGYINSGAVLPDQTVEDGTVMLRIAEGRLADIIIRGHQRLRTDYLHPRIERSAGPPLNIIALKNRLEMIRQNPNIRRVNAELKPGAIPGESRLDVQIEENPPVVLRVQFSNDRPPSIGAEQLRLLARHGNLTGHSDVLALDYGLIRDGIEETEIAGVDDLDVFYVIPINASDTTIALSYSRSNTLVVEETFQELDIESESEDFSVTVRQPLYQTPNTEIALSLTGERRSNDTFLLGSPFSFAPGARNGETDVTVLRFSQEFLTRDQTRAISARSTFSFGIDALGSTDNTGSAPDGEFFAWLGQVQYVLRINEGGAQIILRANTQLAADSLLSLEQFSIGGVDTVRGYREHQLVRDSAVVSSAELRVPLIRNATGQNILQLAPFVDFGHGWNRNDTPEDQHIGSAGIGLLLDLDGRFDVQLYWGYPFRNFDNTDHDLQDEGFHLNVMIELLTF